MWVVTAYLLASTVSIPIYGKFSDVYGRKTMLLSAVGCFRPSRGCQGYPKPWIS